MRRLLLFSTYSLFLFLSILHPSNVPAWETRTEISAQAKTCQEHREHISQVAPSLFSQTGTPEDWGFTNGNPDDVGRPTTWLGLRIGGPDDYGKWETRIRSILRLILLKRTPLETLR